MRIKGNGRNEKLNNTNACGDESGFLTFPNLFDALK